MVRRFTQIVADAIIVLLLLAALCAAAAVLALAFRWMAGVL